MQSKNRDWTIPELTWFLGFDGEAQTIDFCESFHLTFIETERGPICLDITNPTASLDSMFTNPSVTHANILRVVYFEQASFF